MYYTCDACHYTFEADSRPSSCPDCGKEEIGRRIRERIITSSAVREASEEEIAWYKNVQAEIAAEEEQKSNIKKLSDYDMTDDEFNWAIIMTMEYSTDFSVFSTILHSARIVDNPERTLEFYIGTRRSFSRKITAEKAELKEKGIRKRSFYYTFEGPLEEEFEYWEEMGKNLQALYHFRSIDFLSTPNLGNIRRIDLKKIAEEPSDSYKQFLLDWENRL